MQGIRRGALAAVICLASIAWSQNTTTPAQTATAQQPAATQTTAPQNTQSTTAPGQNANPTVPQNDPDPATPSSNTAAAIPANGTAATPAPATNGAVTGGDITIAPDPGANAAGTAPVTDDDKKLRSVPVPQQPQIQQPPLSAHSFDEIVDRMIAREQVFTQNMRQYSPVLETYLQEMKPDNELGAVPTKDFYFLGKLQLTSAGARDASFLPPGGKFKSIWDHLTSIFQMKFMPLGFAQMIMPDNGGLNRQYYDYKFVRREFLGGLRCVVVDVVPKKGTGNGRFLGRVWVEDQDYNIVRFNGTYTPAPFMSAFLHFDSWRLNMQPGVWLPAYIYSEESELKPKVWVHAVRFKAQTRLWGYGVHNQKNQSELTDINVEGDQVKDQSDTGRDMLPVEANRQWEHQAEQNVLERLTKAGLLAQPGDVDKILETVVNNLEITNNLEIQPPVHCRVLLTTPLESFTVGHTIVLSRGLIDTMPDEPTLAAFLAHELAHISLAHRMDTAYAFMDRMLFADEQTYRKLHFHKNQSDEDQADKKALDFMRNSPYKDQLPKVALFLRMLEKREHELPNLVAAHLGNSPFADGKVRMREIEPSSPQLQMRNVTQLPALPLGSRVHVNPYTDQLEMNRGKPVPLLSAREKLSFEVTPVFPYLMRYDAAQGTPVANAAPPADKQ